MNLEIYCVDCNEFVKLNTFSREHKKHEMKVLNDLLEERKKECQQILEVQKKNLSLTSFEESEKNMKRIKDQGSEMKLKIKDHCEKLKTQIEYVKILWCKTIDNKLLKNEKNFADFKENFLITEKQKLVDLEKIIESFDIKSLDKLKLTFTSLPKSIPMYEAELGLCLQESSEIFNAQQYLPIFISDITSTSFNESQSKVPDEVKVAPVLAVMPNSEKTPHTTEPHTTSFLNHSLTKTEEKWEYKADKEVIFVKQCSIYFYILCKKSVHIYRKNFSFLLRTIKLTFDPYDIVFVGKLGFIIDFDEKYLYIVKEDNQINKIYIKTFPNSLSVDNNDGILIAGDNNAMRYDTSSNELSVLPKSSSIGRILKVWRVDSKGVLLISNHGKNKLLRMKKEVIINSLNISLDLEVKEFLIDINNEGIVCLLKYQENSLTILDSNFDKVFSLKSKELGINNIKRVNFDRKYVNLTLLSSKCQWKFCQYILGSE